MRNPLAVFRSRRMAVVFLLGFSSGLPYLLTAGTLQTWMTDAKVDLKHIAAFSSVGLAYTFKVAWAPLLDRYRLPFLGRRRGWILLFQLGMIAALIVMSVLDPRADPERFAVVAVIVAVISASQDIVIDAYNADLLKPEERAAGSATYVIGYRTAMLVAGSLTLILADHLEWQVVYMTMAGLMVVGVIGNLLAEEPVGQSPPRTIAHAVIVPFTEFFKRLGWKTAILVMIFAATYKFGEQFAQTLTSTFFRGVIGFSKTEIGVLNKAIGYFGFMVGGVIGGALVARHGVRKMLVVFGILQIFVQLGYLAIAFAGKDLGVFAISILIENISFAMGTAAFMGAFMGHTAAAVSVTQFALLTSLSTLGSRVLGPLADDLVDAVGWKGFFLTCMAMGLPGILFAWLANKPKSPD